MLLRLGAMVEALCGCLVVKDVVGAKVGQAKSFAPVETFTKVLEAPSLESLSLPSRLEKRSKRSTNELVSTCEI